MIVKDHWLQCMNPERHKADMARSEEDENAGQRS
jgi:hypothetical protein